MKIVLNRTPERVTVDTAEIPPHQTDAMCRTLVGSIGRLFEDPVVQADFQRWKQERLNKART